MTRRKAHYTTRIADMICEEIAMGSTLQGALDAVGYLAPAKSTVWKWFDAHPDFREKYDRALQMQADSHADRIIELGMEVLKNSRQAPAYKVAIDVMKWSTEIRNRGKYGAKGESTKSRSLNPEKLRQEIKRLQKELGVVEMVKRSEGPGADVMRLVKKQVNEE